MTETTRDNETRAEEGSSIPLQTPQGGEAAAPAPVSAPPAPPKAKARSAKKRKKRIKLIVGIVIAALVVGGIVFGLLALFGGDGKQQILTDTTYRGNIQTQITGSGVTTPLISEPIKAGFDQKIDKVLVVSGSTVAAGAPLYSLDTKELQSEYDEAQTTLIQLTNDYKALLKQPRDLQEKIEDTQKKLNGLSIKAPFAGKILDVKVKAGDTVSEGMELATLINDKQMRLTQYFSYAYENDIKVGARATVSIPSSMSTVSAKVEKINKVERISAEGTKLFEVTFIMDNPGTLTEGVNAAATLLTGGETIAPYESAPLKYAETKTLLSDAGGKLLSLVMKDYLNVTAGMSLGTIENTAYANELQDLRDQLDSYDNNIKIAQEKMSDQQETVDSLREALENNVIKAPVSGTVTSVTVIDDQKIEKDAPIMTIADASMLTIEARIDAMNIGNVKVGSTVQITQYGMEQQDFFTGVIETVSFEGKQDQGSTYTYFPATIRVDNPEGKLLTGNYVDYTITASEAVDCIIAPVQSVKYTDQGTVVFIKASSRPDNAIDPGENVEVPDGFYAVPVVTGLSDNYSVEILEGLDEGVEIFTQYLTDQASSWDQPRGGGRAVRIG